MPADFHFCDGDEKHCLTPDCHPAGLEPAYLRLFEAAHASARNAGIADALGDEEGFAFYREQARWRAALALRMAGRAWAPLLPS